MKKYDILSLVALLVLVVVFPVYALREQDRMAQDQVALREKFVSEASVLYVENCASCHGPAGEGMGSMPALNGFGIAEAEYDVLYRTIANAPHGTAMAAWHIDEGGSLTSYEVEGLVNLIKHADWQQVGALADVMGVTFVLPGSPEVEMATMDIGSEPNPHECRSCHEEPMVHADRFGLNCSRCHTLESWKPALLNRHTFMLDHGGQGQIACQTCHTATYSEYTCYECHDHTPEEIEATHAEEGIFELELCAQCHPTGQAGEAEQLQRNTASQGGSNLSKGQSTAPVSTTN